VLSRCWRPQLLKSWCCSDNIAIGREQLDSKKPESKQLPPSCRTYSWTVIFAHDTVALFST
jgi:hypothetical protein